MGGSLAAALTQAGWTVLVHHRRSEVAQRAQDLGYGQRVDDLANGMARSAIAVVCTPVSSIASQVRQLVSQPGRAVVTDIGSVKGALCRELADVSRAGRYVGSHPMAGSHLHGLDHAQAALFRGCTTAIATGPGIPNEAMAQIEGMWHAIGSRTHRMDPDDHDRSVAEVSHAPHVVAAAVAAGANPASLALAASGFRDTTRVAAGDPHLWADILLTNRSEVVRALKASNQRVADVVALLESGDVTQVTAWLARGQEARLRFDQGRRLLAPGQNESDD
jgi:prephenate dehydrogenase